MTTLLVWFLFLFNFLPPPINCILVFLSKFVASTAKLSRIRTEWSRPFFTDMDLFTYLEINDAAVVVV